MIMIFGTLVLNDDISRQYIHFFESFIFGAVRVIKGQKIAQNDKNLSVVLDISGTIHHMIVICGTQL